jgi:hypothetical protein
MSVKHALIISKIVQNYAAVYGSANTMMGPALYNITTAAITLIAEITQKHGHDVAEESASLSICLRAVKEMESADSVARKVRKLVQTIVRVCHAQRPGDSLTQSILFTKDILPGGWKADLDRLMSTSATDGGTASYPTHSTLDASLFDSVLQYHFDDTPVGSLSIGDSRRS